MLRPEYPALVLAPMEGITDAPMRALQGATGAFTYSVSEFLRVSNEVIPARVFRRDIPELNHGAVTPTGLPVQVQLLGGDPERMARSAVVACQAGATAIDLNFGCPAPTVNRHDGGATLLKHPERIAALVRAVREAVPAEIPVSAKLRLGWDSIDAIHENAARAAEGGASWLTIHARTRAQGYAPPVHWKAIGQVRAALALPVIANGDIWTLDDFRRCQDVTGCRHFMIGRGALANPLLSRQIAAELGIQREDAATSPPPAEWLPLLRSLIGYVEHYQSGPPPKVPLPVQLLKRFKQWTNIAGTYGGFRHFDRVKRATSLEEFLDGLKGVRIA